MSRRYWLKWLVVVDVSRHLLLAQATHAGPVNDCARLSALIEQSRQLVSVHVVLADAKFDRERNHLHIRQQVGAQSVILAKRGRPDWKITGIRAKMRKDFPSRLYRHLVQIESVFSIIKRKLSGRASEHSLLTQRFQALLLGLAFNLYRL